MAKADWLTVIALSVGLGLGQILFKKAALVSSPAQGLAPFLRTAMANPWLWAAMLLYGFVTIYWVYVLRHIPLSVAYPVLAASYVVVPLISAVIYGEQYSWRIAAASVCILAGLVILGFEKS